MLRLLETAPAIERSTGARPVASLRDVRHTVDTARAWLAQHPQTTHLAHARAISRLAVTITRGAADSNPRDPTARAEADRWQRIAKNLQDLGVLEAGNRDHLVAELTAANDWLHRQLHAPQPRTCRVAAAGRPGPTPGDCPSSARSITRLTPPRGGRGRSKTRAALGGCLQPHTAAVGATES